MGVFFFIGSNKKELARTTGIEPVYSVLETAVLPLNYARTECKTNERIYLPSTSVNRQNKSDTYITICQG